MREETILILQAKMTEEQLEVLLQEIKNVGEIIGLKLEINKKI
jgi:hypothetical protein